MLCQNCRKNEVNFRYTQVINGEKREIALCDKCAKKLGLESLDFSREIEDLFNMSFAEFREAFTGSNPTISLQQFEDALIELDEKGGGGLNSLATMVKSSVSTISNAFDLIPKRFSKAEEKWLGALDEG